MKSNEKGKGERGMKLEWKVHTKNLLQEVLENKGCAILEKPISILGNILLEVSERASEINDKKLNQLMVRLCLYECADPELEEFDAKFVAYVLSDAYLNGKTFEQFKELGK